MLYACVLYGLVNGLDYYGLWCEQLELAHGFGANYVMAVCLGFFFKKDIQPVWIGWWGCGWSADSAAGQLIQRLHQRLISPASSPAGYNQPNRLSVVKHAAAEQATPLCLLLWALGVVWLHVMGSSLSYGHHSCCFSAYTYRYSVARLWRVA